MKPIDTWRMSEEEKMRMMLGKVPSSVQRLEDRGDVLQFTFTDGSRCTFYHDQDCCEYVSIEDVVGELEDLVGEPLLQAEVVSSDEDNKGPDGQECESCTWTFYKFATVKGYVTVRWFGESNGYYSESVDTRWEEPDA